MSEHPLLTGAFWIDAAERAIATSAETAVGVIGAGAVGILEVDWAIIASVSALASVVSILKSIAATKIGTRGTASLVD